MTTTAATRPASATRSRRDWWIPASLLALAVVPSLGGVFRLVDLSGGRTAENARFFDLPAPILVHIVGATTFLKRHAQAVTRFGGAVLVLVGLLLLTGAWTEMMEWLRSWLAASGFAETSL